MSENTPQQQSLFFEERVSLDALFPGYRQWLAKRQASRSPHAVHSLERGLYDAWQQAVSPRDSKETHH